MSPEESPKFKLIPNPYITGNPVRGQEVFFGREDDFAYVRQRLIAERDGIVMLFVGARRSGKSSIMWQILEGRLGEEFLPVLLDMQRMILVVGDREFFGRMADLVLEGIKDERLVREYYDFEQGSPVIAFDRLLADIQQLFPQKRMIFLVDEAEILQIKVMQEELSGAVLTYMASILESRKISFCFTGSLGLSEAQVEEWRWLAGKGVAREINFLSREDTLRLIQEPVAGYVFYAEGVVNAIYNLTLGQPFYTQVICTNVVDYLNGEQRNQLELEDLDEVVRTIVDNPPPQMSQEWDTLNRQEQLTLSLLSEVSAGLGYGITAEELTGAIHENEYPLNMRTEVIHIALESLFNRKLLERDEERAYYIRVDLLRRWIRRSRSIWRLVEDQQPRKKKRRWAVVVAVAAVLAVAVVAALWKTRATEIKAIQRQQQVAVGVVEKGNIRVTSVPPAMEVWINGQLHDERTPTLIGNLSPGDYTLELRGEKYRSQTRSVPVTAGVTEKVDIALVQKRGEISISSDPPGASFSIHGEGGEEIAGTTPSEKNPLLPGRYEVTVRKMGFAEAKRAFSIADSEVVALPFTLTPDIGHLYVKSNPSGAKIFIDDLDRGLTAPNLVRDLAVGRHRLQLFLQDYGVFETAVSIALGRTDTVTGELAILPATLALKSEPAGANIFVDGAEEPASRTPARLPLSPGTHRVRIELSGYDAESIEKTLEPGATAELSFSLKAQYGKVRIAWPYNGIVEINGIDHPFPPSDIPKQVGIYKIVLKGKTDTMTVEIKKDKMEIVRLP